MAGKLYSADSGEIRKFTVDPFLGPVDRRATLVERVGDKVLEALRTLADVPTMLQLVLIPEPRQEDESLAPRSVSRKIPQSIVGFARNRH